MKRHLLEAIKTFGFKDVTYPARAEFKSKVDLNRGSLRKEPAVVRRPQFNGTALAGASVALRQTPSTPLNRRRHNQAFMRGHANSMEPGYDAHRARRFRNIQLKLQAKASKLEKLKRLGKSAVKMAESAVSRAGLKEAIKLKKWKKFIPDAIRRQKTAAPSSWGSAANPKGGIEVLDHRPADLSDREFERLRNRRFRNDQFSGGAPDPWTGRRPKRESAAATVNAMLRESAGYSYSSTQINMDKDLAKQVIKFSHMIQDKDLVDDGRENTPHITVKYGLHTNKASEVERLLKDVGPIRYKLGEVSKFECKDYDVIMVKVDSPDLIRLNNKIKDGTPCTDTHPTYTPHMTIAYVKKGYPLPRPTDYFKGMGGTAHEVVFSPKSGNLKSIKVGK